MVNRKLRRFISPFKIIILGFFLVIMAGALLLTLPISTQTGEWAKFSDALFTAVSATCVTGLIVQNTAEYWSFFGQLIILILIQIGGMGVITVAVAITRYSGKKITLMQRSTMQEAIAAPQMGGMVQFTGFVLKYTFMIEGIGAVSMMPTFIKQFGFFKGLWYSIFHSVSAFCNAGFDLMGEHNGDTSLMCYSDNPFINIPITLLIIFGGIGFLTWKDFEQHKLRFKKYKTQSKMALITTAVLLIVPALVFFIFEFSSEEWSYMSLSEKMLASWFQSVTPRTAGFNTVNLADMTPSSQLLTILLMLTGGTSGSTAGGFKTTTLAVLFATVISVFRKKPYTQSLGRKISSDSVRNAATVFLLYIVMFLLGGFLICHIDGVPLLSALYEAASAVGTVGLTLGITSTLSLASQVILMFLMFFGRVGGLTIIFALISDMKPVRYKLPEEKITVG